MQWPDIDLNMSLFDWFKPLDRITGTIDKLVDQKTLDVDLANQIKADLHKSDNELKALAEQTYMAELNVKTIPWVDAFHKCGRQLLSFLNILVAGAILIYMVRQGQTVTLETFAVLMGMSAPASIYNYVKQKGDYSK